MSDLVIGIIFGVLGVLITIFFGWLTLQLTRKHNDKAELREEKRLDEIRQREYQDDVVNAPKTVVSSCVVTEDGTILEIKNIGATPAQNVIVDFQNGTAAAHFPFSPRPVLLVQPGETARLEANARPIHYLNHYLLSDPVLAFRWTSHRLGEMSRTERIRPSLPLGSKPPIVD